MAGLREENKWENEIYRIEESDPVVGGEDGISNKPQKQLANRTQWLKAKINELFGKNTPKKITKDTTNLVANDGHTHEIEKGSLTTSGIVQLTDSVNQDSSVFAATAKAVKTAYDKAVDALNVANTKLGATATAVAANKLATARTISLTGAVSGSGSFDGSGNLSINTADNLTVGLVTSTSATGVSNVATSNSNTYLNVVETRGGVANAIGSSTLITGNRGITVSSDTGGKLIITGMAYSSAINSESGSQLATSAAVKTAYDKGVEALNVANAKQSPATTLAGYGITDWVINSDLSTTDLDTIKTAGTYAQLANANCTAERHYPKTEAGALLVLASTYGYQQQYTTWLSNEIYVRNIGNSTGVWSAWRRVDAQNKLDATATAAAANKLATARTISLTGAVSGSGSFDGSGNLSINTADNLTIGLVTSTSSTGTSNTSTSNTNTYLNVVEKRGTSSNAVGSSTRVTGTGLVDVYSDTSGLLTIRGNKDNSKLNTSGDQRLNGKLTVNDILLATNSNQSLSQVINAINTLFTGNLDGFKNIVNAWGVSGVNPMGVAYNFENPNARYISMGPMFGNLIIQWGLSKTDSNGDAIITFPISFTNNFSIIGMHRGGSVAITTEKFSERSVNKTVIMLRSSTNSYSANYLVQFFCAGT